METPTMRVMMILAASVMLAGHSQAQEAKPCTAIVAPPAEFAAWSAVQPLAAAVTAEDAKTAVLPLGAAREIGLLPVGELKYAVQPVRPDEGAVHGGIVAFDVARRGTYRVALGSGAWIEVVSGTRARQSTGHGHGPECSGIRKIVDFELSPGRHLLQLSASKEARVKALIVPAALPAKAR